MQIVTNIEQSKRLVACGVDSTTADVYRVFDPYTKTQYSNITKAMDDKFDKEFDLPAWSFTTLWEMMPIEISSNIPNHKEWTDEKELTGNSLMYCHSCTDGLGGIVQHTQVKFHYEKGHLLDVVVSMVEWLMQRKLIKIDAL